MDERGGDALAPVILALAEKGFDEEAARIAEDRHQQEHAHPAGPDPHALLPEIDLQLIARRRFDPHRRHLRGPLRAPQVADRALDRPGTHRQPALREQPPHDGRIARRRPEIPRARVRSRRLRQPPAPRSDLVTGRQRVPQVLPDRVDRDAQLPGNRLLADPATPQRPNRGHYLAFDHRHLRARRYQHVPRVVHPTLLRGGSVLLSRGDQYRCRST